ncbi:hypothetical protein NRA28_18105, partial [Acinetobacter baumannii]|nr:hypothetical protein [Acinetobacter baumannii]
WINQVKRPFVIQTAFPLSLIHISEPTRLDVNSYAVFCLKKKYVRLKERDYIKSKSGALVNLEYASSGQQEALPLLLSIVCTSKNTTLLFENHAATSDTYTLHIVGSVRCV